MPFALHNNTMLISYFAMHMYMIKVMLLDNTRNDT